MNLPRRRRAAVAVLSLMTFVAAAGWVRAADDVKLEQKEHHVAVTIGGQPFTNYYFAAEEGRPYVRPYFFPVRAADGTEVTADQVRAGGDHPHHRSLWVAHGDVNGADHWSLAQKPVPRQIHVKFESAEGDTIVQLLEWEGKGSADGKAAAPILAERRTLHFTTFPDGSRGIDITSEFRALADEVTFGDTKEAGLCAVRVAKSIADTATITTSERKGGSGKAGETAAWGKAAKWCDLSGKIGDKTYGVAVLDHPSNPKHPTRWHVRGYGLLAANIFGLHDFDKAPKGAGDFKLKKDEPATFRYRVIIHAGAADPKQLESQFREFATTRPGSPAR